MPTGGKTWRDYLNANATPYASICPRRNPKFKTHKGIGQAKGAVTNQVEGWVLEWTEGGWKEHSSWFLPEDLHCPSCHEKKAYGWEPLTFLNNNKVYGSIRVCYECHSQLRKLPAEEAWSKLFLNSLPSNFEPIHVGELT